MCVWATRVCVRENHLDGGFELARQLSSDFCCRVGGGGGGVGGGGVAGWGGWVGWRAGLGGWGWLAGWGVVGGQGGVGVGEFELTCGGVPLEDLFDLSALLLE